MQSRKLTTTATAGNGTRGTAPGSAPGPCRRHRLLTIGPRVRAPPTRELSVVDGIVRDVAAGRSRTLIVTGPAGIGKSALLDAMTHRAGALGMRLGHGTSAPVEGAWPYAQVVEALADTCRRHPTLLDGLADHHRGEIDRALAGAESTWSGASTHHRVVRSRGCAGVTGGGHARAVAHHRRRP